MSNPRTLGPWLRRFLTEYLVTERNLARNTQKSYRDTFALLLPFVATRIRKPVERMAVEDLAARRVREFLPATSGYRQSAHSHASSPAAIPPISSGAAASGRSPPKRRHRGRSAGSPRLR